MNRYQQLLVNELADECIREDCGYEALPQHVDSLLVHAKNDPKLKNELSGHFQDMDMWQWLIDCVMRDDRESALEMVATIRRERNEWLKSWLVNQVEDRMDYIRSCYERDHAEQWSERL
jgi:hypothetical protein